MEDFKDKFTNLFTSHNIKNPDQYIKAFVTKLDKDFRINNQNQAAYFLNFVNFVDSKVVAPNSSKIILFLVC